MRRLNLFYLLAFLLLIPSCLNWFLEKPTFILKGVSVENFSFTEAHFLFMIEVQNPNRFDLKLQALEYRIYLNDQALGKGQLTKEFQVAASSAAVVEVPLEADFKSLGNPLSLVLSGKALKYKIEGVAVVKASLGSATVPFSESGEIGGQK